MTSVLSCSVSYWFEWCVVFWTSDTFLLALGASSSRWSGGGAMPLIVSSQDVNFACVEHCMPILEYSAGADVQSTACGAPQEFLASFPITEFRLLSFWTFFFVFLFLSTSPRYIGCIYGGSTCCLHLQCQACLLVFELIIIPVFVAFILKYHSLKKKMVCVSVYCGLEFFYVI